MPFKRQRLEKPIPISQQGLGTVTLKVQTLYSLYSAVLLNTPNNSEFTTPMNSDLFNLLKGFEIK